MLGMLAVSRLAYNSCAALQTLFRTTVSPLPPHLDARSVCYPRQCWAVQGGRGCTLASMRRQGHAHRVVMRQTLLKTILAVGMLALVTTTPSSSEDMIRPQKCSAVHSAYPSRVSGVCGGCSMSYISTHHGICIIPEVMLPCIAQPSRVSGVCMCMERPWSRPL